VSAKSFAAVMAVLGVVALLGFGVIAKNEKQLDVGEAAPVVDLERLEDGAGAGEDAETASIADYRGQWVLLNIWASWCGPCETEAPDLVEFQRQNGAPTFTILGINTQDGTGDGLEFAEQYRLNYDSLRDGSGDYADELGSTGVPESILLDPEGDVAYIRRGEVDSELLEAEVLPLISGATVPPAES
jgi:cytochrome c biogenesis protein CcmG, thiol:disulfide interchange protein DsbE